MRKKSREILKKIHNLHKRRRELHSVLLQSKDFAVGSVSRVKRRCGNPYCHCSEEPTHEQTIFVFTDDDGKRRCQHVRRCDESRLEKAAKQYQDFRESLKELKHLNSKELELLRAFGRSRALRYKKSK